MRPRVVTFASIKGGVGKTTLSLAFGSWLAAKGFRVLYLDNDFLQASTTLWFIGQYAGDADYNAFANRVAIYNISAAMARKCNLSDAILWAPESRTALIPASPDSPDPRELFKDESGLEAAQAALFHGESEILNEFDFLIVDSPGELSMVTKWGLVMADIAVIPTEVEIPSMGSIPKLLELIGDIQMRWNTGSKTIRIVPNKVKISRRSSYEAIKLLEERYGAFLPNDADGNIVFATDAATISNFVDYGSTIAPKSKAGVALDIIFNSILV